MKWSDDTATHILVVDDDDRLRTLLVRFLSESGFAVSQAAQAAQARQLLKLFVFDLMILDVMMPGESGIALATALAGSDMPPVLMLSARAEAADRVAGLEAGVDDYLIKPFEPQELLLRIRAILRRIVPAPGSRLVTFGGYTLDLNSGVLRHGDEPMYLTAAETALLTFLAGHAGRAVPREQLARQLGQETGRGIDVQIARLRKKIEPSPARPRHILTVRGEGYVLQGNTI